MRARLRWLGLWTLLGVVSSAQLYFAKQRLARDPAQKIAAIKLHREQTGLGLAEAKANIEDFTKTIQ